MWINVEWNTAFLFFILHIVGQNIKSINKYISITSLQLQHVDFSKLYSFCWIIRTLGTILNRIQNLQPKQSGLFWINTYTWGQDSSVAENNPTSLLTTTLCFSITSLTFLACFIYDMNYLISALFFVKWWTILYL